MRRKCIPRNRDKNLHSFAEEHKHGLIFCKRLEEGLSKNVKTEIITNYVESVLTDEQLSEIGKKLIEKDMVENKFEPQFWQ